MSMPSFSVSTVKIPSATPGWTLDAWKYLPSTQNPDATKPCPVIVMAHGFSANKLMALSPYGEAFASAGYGCVVFDYRRWGKSDGTPRHALYVSEQLEDYRTVIKWARQQPEFDPQRIVVWGSSFSGGHAVTLASEANLSLAAAMGQCAFVGASLIKLNFATIKGVVYGIADLVKQAIGLAPVYIPAAAQPGEVGGLTAPGTVEGLSVLCKDPKDYPNEITASSLLKVPFYHPNATAHKIECPLLLLIPEADNLCSPEAALEVVKKTKNGEAVRTTGGHFDLYPNTIGHEKALKAQLDFLRKHVPVS
ncbi:alpha/beta-hydrolase [Rickenella mellea]|uniref:Alpha/beta-hydrolase n=1 Tax=Rickenella mellea TaxID=50990 RepID=A0A4Y7QEL3_9AGAM|nr:alpha/beta-hydrolase [Rickenella mellea]